jgi:hypothetical protein
MILLAMLIISAVLIYIMIELKDYLDKDNL